MSSPDAHFYGNLVIALLSLWALYSWGHFKQGAIVWLGLAAFLLPGLPFIILICLALWRAGKSIIRRSRASPTPVPALSD